MFKIKNKNENKSISDVCFEPNCTLYRKVFQIIYKKYFFIKYI